MSNQVGAVFVSYYPDAEFGCRLRQVAAQVAHVVVVDNGSTDSSLTPLTNLANDSLTIIRNKSNFGVATALNQGAAALRAKGIDWALLMDQDSEPEPDMVSRLQATADRPSHRAVALVAPNVVDRGLAAGTRRWFTLQPRYVLGFARLQCNQDVLEDVVAITSGSLIALEPHAALGGFDERLFIDFVDTDYCLRLAAADYAILVDCKAHLLHSVGAKQARRLFGLQFVPTFHSPLRRYYLFRNRVHMIRAHAGRWPHWFVYETSATLHTLAGIILFEPQKAHQLYACLLGTWDGLLGRSGSAQRDVRS